MTPETAPRDTFPDRLDGPAPRSRAVWVMGAVAGLVAAWLGYRALQPEVVEVTAVELQRAEQVLALTGRIRPQVTVTVLPRVAGQIVQLTREEGEVVTAGELLVRLDAAGPAAAVEQSVSAVKAQERVVVQAERDFARALALQGRGLITLKDFEDARFALDQSKVELGRLQATRREVVSRLDETRIAAPVSGVVLARPVDLGQVVSTQSTIYEIAPLEGVEVEAEVDEQFLPQMRVGLLAQIAIPGIGGFVPATLSYISAKVDPRIGGATVRLRFEEPVGELRAGVTVDVNILVDERERVVTLDRSQILGRDPQAAVLVVRNGRVERRGVQYLEWPSARVIVTGGIQPGEQLLADPRPDLIGQRVEVIDTEATRTAATARAASGDRGAL